CGPPLLSRSPPGDRRSIATCVGLPFRRPPRVSRPCGPSPRAWGSLRVPRGELPAQRSIPTCVGLTRPAGGRSRCTPVHPHVRGAHDLLVAAGLPKRGPSPRAWGSRGNILVVNVGDRSIPTCVGLTESHPPHG